MSDYADCLTVDLSDYDEGVHTVTVSVKLPDGAELSQTVTVTVEITSDSDNNDDE